MTDWFLSYTTAEPLVLDAVFHSWWRWPGSPSLLHSFAHRLARRSGNSCQLDTNVLEDQQRYSPINFGNRRIKWTTMLVTEEHMTTPTWCWTIKAKGALICRFPYCGILAYTTKRTNTSWKRRKEQRPQNEVGVVSQSYIPRPIWQNASSCRNQS